MSTLAERKDAIREFMIDRNLESMAVLSNLEDKDLATPVYSTEAGNWTVREVVAHLADSERGQLGQIQRLAASQQTIPPDFDLNRWNKRAVEKRADKTVRELLADIQEAYSQQLAVLDMVTEADLDKQGRHPRGDEPTLETFFRHLAQHRAQHAAEIKAAIGR